MATLSAPFPWFGGKRQVAPVVWRALGDVGNYVEPFFGSGAVLLNRPHVDPGIETVNDIDGYVCNAWRAIRSDPGGVAEYVDWPVNECDLHARHLWLLERKEGLAPRLMGDPDYFDARVAGYWIWGICAWIGGEWCSGKGPWASVDGVLVKNPAGKGVQRRLPHLGHAGMGVHRRLPHLGHAGMGVHRVGVSGLREWMDALSDRLRRVRVCCGDWTRVMGPSVTLLSSTNGIFLDPPYSHEIRTDSLYSHEMPDASAVRDWCIENGRNRRMRIVLCGYEGEHEMPEDWRVVEWKTVGGYSNQNSRGNENRDKERLWLSPHCMDIGDDRQMDMFGVESRRVCEFEWVDLDELPEEV